MQRDRLAASLREHETLDSAVRDLGRLYDLSEAEDHPERPSYRRFVLAASAVFERCLTEPLFVLAHLDPESDLTGKVRRGTGEGGLDTMTVEEDTSAAFRHQGLSRNEDGTVRYASIFSSVEAIRDFGVPPEVKYLSTAGPTAMGLLISAAPDVPIVLRASSSREPDSGSSETAAASPSYFVLEPGHARDIAAGKNPVDLASVRQALHFDPHAQKEKVALYVGRPAVRPPAAFLEKLEALVASRDAIRSARLVEVHWVRGDDVPGEIRDFALIFDGPKSEGPDLAAAIDPVAKKFLSEGIHADKGFVCAPAGGSMGTGEQGLVVK